MAAFKATNAALAPADDQTTQWLIGWGIMLAVLILIGRTQTGRALIYYSLALMLVFLAVTQYKWIAQNLAQVGINTPEQSGGTQYGGIVTLSGNAPTTSLSYDFSAGGLTVPMHATM